MRNQKRKTGLSVTAISYPDIVNAVITDNRILNEPVKFCKDIQERAMDGKLSG